MTSAMFKFCLLVVGLCHLSLLASGSHQTGNEHRELIIGGNDAPKGRYPYFATFDHFGGGVLIAPDIILTAGHCNPPLDQNVKVRINHDTFQSTNFAVEADDEETFSIVAIKRHPSYYTISWDEHVNDFNLFKISGFSKEDPVKLNRNPNLPHAGDTVTVVGMGSMDPNPETFVETSATTLQEVDLRIISHNQCEASEDPKNRPQVSYAGRVFEESMVCTSGGPHNEKDACAFDSGSPLLLTPENSIIAAEDIVVGLVSWGENCADPYFPAVNARVSFAMDWIDRTVCKLSEADPSLLTEFNCGEPASPDVFPFGPLAIQGGSMGNLRSESYFVVAGFLLMKACLFVAILGAAVKKIRGQRNTQINDAENVPLQSTNADAIAPTYSTL